MQVSLTKVSSNVKTGKIPVSTTTFESCPNRCSLKNNGCYAGSGPLAMHWKKVTEGTRGTDWETFCGEISNLPDGQLWRHNQAGDLCGDAETIDFEKLAMLVDANKGKRGFTYTHYDVLNNLQNKYAVKLANSMGFPINLSAESLEEADALVASGAGPVVTIMPMDASKVTVTPAGNKVILCPATYRDDVSCESCELCHKQGKRAIVGFPVHGTSKKKAEKVFMMKSA